MYKSILISIQIILFALHIQGQTLKSYSGPYKIGYPFNKTGHATYKYYIDKGKTIKKGNFSFSTDMKNSLGRIIIKISGKYDNNLKDGLWNYNAKVKDQTSLTIMTLKANYSKGYPNGIWMATITQGTNISFKLTAYFKKGTLIRDFIYHFKSPTNLDNIKIKMDNQGYYLSEEITKNQDISIRNFYKKVYLNSDIDTQRAKEIIDTLLLMKNDSLFLADYPYALSETHDRFPQKAYPTFFNFIYLFDDIPGDINYKSTNYNYDVLYDYDGFKYYELVKHQTLTDKYNEKIYSADRFFREEDFESAIEYYKQALTYKNKKYAANQIALCNKRIEEIKEQINKEFNYAIKNGDRNFKNYKFNEAKNWYAKALKIKEKNEYAQNRIYLINGMKDKGEKYLTKSNEFLKNNQLDSTIHYLKIVDYFYPDNPDIKNSIAWALILDKQFEKARKVIENALQFTDRSNSTYPYLIENLAHCYLFTGKIEKAKEIYYGNTNLIINKMPWADAIVSDFNQFIDLGIESEYYYEIAKKLRRKKMLNISK